MKVELVSKMVGVGKYEKLTSEEIVSAIARHGIIKEDKGKLVKYLIDNKHFSPLDMINFGFEIETSRAIGRQLLRHWSIKPQEHSQRYSDRVQFEPIELRREHPTNRQSSTEVFDPKVVSHTEPVYTQGFTGDWEVEVKASELIEAHLRRTEEVYKKLLSKGVAKECARMILPEATTTTMTMNGSLRSWLAFLNIRLEEHTQKEAREIATLIGESLEKELPNVFGTIDWKNGMFM